MSDHPTSTTRRDSVFPILVGALVMMLIVLAITMLVRAGGPEGAADEAERASARQKNLEALTETYATELTTYGWVDKEKGIVRIPIDQAMEITMAKLNEQKPRAAYPIATPAPAEAAASPAASPEEQSAPQPSPTTEATLDPDQPTTEATPDQPTTASEMDPRPEEAATTASPAESESSQPASSPAPAQEAAAPTATPEQEADAGQQSQPATEQE